MEPKIDRRIKKTRLALKNAYLDLVEQYSDKEITVLMITQHADVNRSTFYTHYSNKNEFLDEILYDVLDGLKTAILKPFANKQKIHVNKLAPTTITIFEYIEKNKRIFRALYVENESFKNELENLFYRIFTEDIHIETKSFIGEANYDIFLHYQTNATLGLIFFWIENNFKHPATYMMDQLTTFSNTQVIYLKKQFG